DCQIRPSGSDTSTSAPPPARRPGWLPHNPDRSVDSSSLPIFLSRRHAEDTPFGRTVDSTGAAGHTGGRTLESLSYIRKRLTKRIELAARTVLAQADSNRAAREFVFHAHRHQYMARFF